MLSKFRKFHILFFIFVFGFTFCLTNGFADKERAFDDPVASGAPIASGADDSLIPVENFDFPTADGAEYIQGTDEFQRVPDNIIGTNDFEKMRDIPSNSPDYILGNKVGMLLTPSRFDPRRGWICTGFLVGPDLFMTNHHCIHDNVGLLPLENARIYMDYYQDRDVDRGRGGVTARVLGVLRMDALKDYALLRLDRPIGNIYGWLNLDTTTVPDSTQSVKLISHPDGRSKEIVRRNTEIVDIPEGHPLVDYPFALAYLADSEGGASGSPVFLRHGSSVIAIHHSAWTSRGEPTFNAGSLMSYIVPEIEPFLRESNTPDLVVEAPQVSRAWLPPGEPFTLSVTVKNQGLVASSGTTLRFYQSSDDSITTSDVEVGTAFVNALAPSETSVASVTLTVPFSEGDYYYGACIDAAGSEIITDNNCSAGTIVTASTAPPVYMYWTDWGTNKIQRSTFTGTHVQNVVVVGTPQPSGIAVDVAGGYIYWADILARSIYRANLDGSNAQTVLTGLGFPLGLALDVGRGHLYWVNFGSGSIQRADLNGSNVQTLLVGLPRPTSIALDVAGGKMYWTDFGPETIQRANLDGTGIEILVNVDIARGLALDLAAGKMYWTRIAALQSSIQRADLSGSSVETVVPGLDTPYGIALGIPLPSGPTIPDPTDPIANPLDVDGDGQLTVIDLAIVALSYGTQVPAGTSLPADVNNDGTVNLLDLTLVANGLDAAGGTNKLTQAEMEKALIVAAEQAAALEGAAGAPMLKGHGQVLPKGVVYSNVADALADAGHLGHNVPALLTELLQLLTEMAEIPETTALLPNYPNPFNPETWIPYHLATDATVALTIYDVRGSMVRELRLGHQVAGVYESRGRAAYWDGKNQLGEHVASGVYFYTLTAGEFTATRKLLIAK